MANSAGHSSLQPELWRKQMMTDARDLLFINRFMGSSEQSMIQELPELKAAKGDKVNFGLGMKLSGNGITGDSEMEGNEEKMVDYEEDMYVNMIRNAVRLTGRMDEKKTVYDMRVRAKDSLATWLAEYIEADMFRKLCGDTTTTGHDFANDTTAAAATRTCMAGGQTSIGSITSAMKMDTKVLDKAKQTAILASPRIKPLRVNGKEMFVAILHPYDATNLRQDPVWNQAQREANVRGDENPIFSGALGVYNGIIVHEHEYIYRYADGSSCSVSRNLLCGQQSGVIAWGESVPWVEEYKDYKNKYSVCCGAMFGTLKPMFNSLDYGVITMPCASAAASTA